MYRQSDQQRIARYTYDALGRRISKHVENCGSLNTQAPGDFFYYDGNRVVEYHKTVLQQPPPPPPPPPPPGGEKRVEGASDGNDAEYAKDMPGNPLRFAGEGLGEIGNAGSAVRTDGVASGVPAGRPDQVRVDDINARQKHEVLAGNDVPLGKHSSVNYSEGGEGDNPVDLVLDQEYVYGTQYIDELVAFYAHQVSLPNWRYVFQDAGYNVVGYLSHTGSLMRQYAYHPYGQLQAVENGNGTATNDTELSMLYRGLWLDRETACRLCEPNEPNCPSGTYTCPPTAATLIYNRGRYYNVPLGRPA